jgi:excisionase family DNA binding protein
MALKFPSGRDKPDYDRIGSDLMTMNEAAEYLRISRRTLERMKAAGVGPVWTRLSRGRIGYRMSDLDGFIASQAQKEMP